MNEPHSPSTLTQLLSQHECDRLKITFKHGDKFILEDFVPVDPEIYNDKGRWCCTVIEAISGNHPIFHKLFLSGSGLDILEEDIEEIIEVSSGKVLFSLNDNAAEQDAAANP